MGVVKSRGEHFYTDILSSIISTDVALAIKLKLMVEKIIFTVGIHRKW